MPKQISANAYEVTHIVLDEDQWYRLELLMQERNEVTVRNVREALDRAQRRVSGLPLEDLLA